MPPCARSDRHRRRRTRSSRRSAMLSDPRARSSATPTGRARTTASKRPQHRDDIPPFDPAHLPRNPRQRLLSRTAAHHARRAPQRQSRRLDGRDRRPRRLVHRRPCARLRLRPAIAARQAGRSGRQDADARRPARHHDAAASRRAPRQHPQAHPPLRDAAADRRPDRVALRSRNSTPPIRRGSRASPDDYFATIVDGFLATGKGKRGTVGAASSVLVDAAADRPLRGRLARKGAAVRPAS